MNKRPWSEEYSVGIEEIDEQHKCLVAHLNELHDALEQQRERPVVSAVIHMLVEYVKIHFAVEETLMRYFHYEGYVEHKLIHDEIMQRLLDYQEEYLAGDDKVATEMHLFLKGWLFDHIKSIDQPYGTARREATLRDQPRI